MKYYHENYCKGVFLLNFLTTACCFFLLLFLFVSFNKCYKTEWITQWSPGQRLQLSLKSGPPQMFSVFELQNDC